MHRNNVEDVASQSIRWKQNSCGLFKVCIITIYLFVEHAKNDCLPSPNKMRQRRLSTKSNILSNNMNYL